jgi:prepilin-type N-terminal cleavage/methylation domain-containing protein
MRRQRGFTLIELMMAVAIFAVLAAIGITWSRASRRNAGVAATTAALQMRIEQLQYQALADQVDHVLVLLDVPNNDATQCGSILSSACARLYQVRNPNPSWKLQDFDVNAPGANVDAIVDDDRLGEGINFYLAGAAATLPVPFTTYSATFKVFDTDLVASCPGSRQCIAFRFKADGTVIPEPKDPSSPPGTKTGHAFAIGSELTGTTGGARQLGVLVSSPAGVVRPFTVP